MQHAHAHAPHAHMHVSHNHALMHKLRDRSCTLVDFGWFGLNMLSAILVAYGKSMFKVFNTVIYRIDGTNSENKFV